MTAPCLHLRAGAVVDGPAPAGACALLDSDPLAQLRHYHLCDRILGYGAGTSESGAGDQAFAAFPHTEFTVITEGKVVLTDGGGVPVTLEAGDCAVIPQGARVRWTQSGRVRRTFMVFQDAAGPSTDVVKIDPLAALAPSKGPAEELLLSSPPPAARNRIWFEGRSGKLRIGVWECTPYARKSTTPPHCELMQILSGTVTITHTSGRSWTVLPGETIVVPAGADNAWTSNVTVRKVFCIVG